MAKKNDRDNLGYLGTDFQYKLAKAFFEDKKFFMGINSIVNQNMFTDTSLRTCIGVLKEYYEKYELVPSYKTMEIELRQKAQNEMDREFLVETIKRIKETSSEGTESIHEKADKFFKQQNIVKVANEILKIASDGDITKYPECVELIQKAMEVGADDDMGISVFDNLDEVLSDEYRTPIPTGIGKVDETLEGGLGKGELGIIVGPSSFGKTSMTTAMACHAATCKGESNNNEGFKVLQIIFEDRPKQIQRKYLGRITGIEAKDLSKPDFINQVKKTITDFEDKEMLKKNVRIKRFPSGEVTATQIGQFIKKLINSGFKPDLVIVDYFECVKLEKGRDVSDNEWTKEGYTMRKFESMAGEMDFALWIPTQGTRDSLGAEIVTMDKAGGSFKKIQIGHIIMSIARTMDDIAKCLATIAVLKNRAGSAGKVFNNVEFNNGTCRISTDNVDIYDSMSEFNSNRSETQKKEMYDTAKEVLSKLSNNSTK